MGVGVERVAFRAGREIIPSHGAQRGTQPSQARTSWLHSFSKTWVSWREPGVQMLHSPPTPGPAEPQDGVRLSAGTCPFLLVFDVGPLVAFPPSSPVALAQVWAIAQARKAFPFTGISRSFLFFQVPFNPYLLHEGISVNALIQQTFIGHLLHASPRARHGRVKWWTHLAPAFR